MDLTVGAVLEGKVKSITNFGAFVALDSTTTGMVHISEVANTYVSNIRDHLQEGQDVQVMVLGNDDGKLKLSIKRLQSRESRSGREERQSADRQRQNRSAAPVAPKTQEQLFEEKLKKFMAESDSNLSCLRQYDQPRPRRRR